MVHTTVLWTAGYKCFFTLNWYFNLLDPQAKHTNSKISGNTTSNFEDRVGTRVANGGRKGGVNIKESRIPVYSAHDLNLL